MNPDLSAPEKCACGYVRTHHLIQPDCRYTWIGWILLLIGISALPREVAFRCSVCKTVFETTKDPAIRQKHRYC